MCDIGCSAVFAFVFHIYYVNHNQNKILWDFKLLYTVTKLYGQLVNICFSITLTNFNLFLCYARQDLKKRDEMTCTASLIMLKS